MFFDDEDNNNPGRMILGYVPRRMEGYCAKRDTMNIQGRDEGEISMVNRNASMV